MSRLTKQKDSGHYLVSDDLIEQGELGYTGKAVEKLAQFENMLQSLIDEQEQIIAELDKLRTQSKTNTVKYKQLFANKLLNNNFIAMIKRFGIVV